MVGMAEKGHVPDPVVDRVAKSKEGPGEVLFCSKTPGGRSMWPGRMPGKQRVPQQ